MKVQWFVPIVKPVSYKCNLRCTYCYYGPARKDELEKFVPKVTNLNSVIMTDEVLESLVRETCTFNNDVAQFIWHGGEPLLAGLSFFEKAISLQAKYKKPDQIIINSIQTNATLLNEEWASFFVEHNFYVGVSLDGPAMLHDILRFYPGKRGSFSKVMKGIQHLRDAGLDFTVICTVNSVNVNYPDEIFRFFISQKFHRLKFLHLHEPERFGNLREIAAAPDAYVDFIVAIFEKWIQHDDPEVYISELSGILRRIFGGLPTECIFLGECANYFTIEFDGSVYPCDTVPGPRERWRFGNIRDGIASILSSPAFDEFCQLFEEIRQKAQKEDWFPLINIGCLGDYYPTIDKRESRNTFAPAWQKIAAQLQKRLEKLGLSKEIKLKPR